MCPHVKPLGGAGQHHLSQKTNDRKAWRMIYSVYILLKHMATTFRWHYYNHSSQERKENILNAVREGKYGMCRQQSHIRDVKRIIGKEPFKPYVAHRRSSAAAIEGLEKCLISEGRGKFSFSASIYKENYEKLLGRKNPLFYFVKARTQRRGGIMNIFNIIYTNL